METSVAATRSYCCVPRLALQERLRKTGSVELVARSSAIGVRVGRALEIGRKHAATTEEAREEPFDTTRLVRRAIRAGQVEPAVGSFGSSSSVGTAFSCSFHTLLWAPDRFKNVERKLPNHQFRFVMDQDSREIEPLVASRSVSRARRERGCSSSAGFRPNAVGWCRFGNR